MNDYFWWPCPPCRGTGKVSEPYLPILSGATVITYRERDCQCCDGEGKIKLPWGYELQPTQVARVYTAVSANPGTT